MAGYLLIAALVILICILFNRISNKLGIPMLFAFIAIGMIFGSDGIGKIYFENYAVSQNICSVALIFIMFYGGFGTKWGSAKPVAFRAVILSSLGVLLTAGITGMLCYFVLDISLLDSLLIGSVISSTDAASVFSILRSKRLNLKYNTASMLEIESGSNDPFSYMLTITMLSIINGNADITNITYSIIKQIIYGGFVGIIVALAAIYVLKKYKFSTKGFDAAFVLAIAVFSYAMAELISGNGYLSTYIVGIILGNQKFENKKVLVNFFDGITGLMQMLIFFLLGLLSFPSRLPEVIIPSVVIWVFLTFVARPLAVALILTPSKCPIKQQLFVSWTGLRGASSIVFAIVATTNEAFVGVDIFHIVFCIVLLSIAIQGTLIPFVANKLKMIDDNENVLRTFNDYTEDNAVQFIKLKIDDNHPWKNKMIKTIKLLPDTLLVLLIRDKEQIIPNGNTVIYTNDIVVLSAPTYLDESSINVLESVVTKDSDYIGKKISEIDMNEGALIILIRRNGREIIPNGNKILKEKDTLVIVDKIN